MWTDESFKSGELAAEKALSHAIMLERVRSKTMTTSQSLPRPRATVPQPRNWKPTVRADDHRG